MRWVILIGGYMIGAVVWLLLCTWILRRGARRHTWGKMQMEEWITYAVGFTLFWPGGMVLLAICAGWEAGEDWIRRRVYGADQ